MPGSDPLDVMNEKMTQQPIDGKRLVVQEGRIDAIAGLNGYSDLARLLLVTLRYPGAVFTVYCTRHVPNRKSRTVG